VGLYLGRRHLQWPESGAPATAWLRTQDGQRAQQIAQGRPGKNQISTASSLDGPHPREQAYRAFDAILSAYSDKYPPRPPSVWRKLARSVWPSIDFPATHWQPIRTRHPIESAFATIRLRTNKTRGCVSRQTILSLVFQLGHRASKRWRRLRGFKHRADVVRGVRFENGVRAGTKNSRVAA
jgi:hypothetical protein